MTKSAKSPEKSAKSSAKSTKAGGRNLVILGVASAVIALITAGISLFIYHTSGDIYLDRSRPGYLPDVEEIEAETTDSEDTEYVFEKNGQILVQDLDAYLENLEQEIDDLDSYAEPFSSSGLSDDSLGIPSAASSDTSEE